MGLVYSPTLGCIFTYIWLIFMVNVGKYTIHGSYGIYIYDYNVSFPVAALWFWPELLGRLEVNLQKPSP